jgi:DNA polymerase III subunit beta
MKFIVSSSALLKQLQLASGVLASNSTLPIIDNFLFDIDEKKLTVTSTDLDTTMILSLEIESKEKGSVAIPSRLLLDTLKSLPDQPLTFSVDPENYNIEIDSDFGKYKLAGYPGSDFPKTPLLESSSQVTLKAEILHNAINKTLFATGNDELRPVMTGVFFEMEESEIRFVATDAHKLVRYTRSDAKSQQGAALIVPKKPLIQLKNILQSMDEDVIIDYNNTNIHFSFGHVKVITRLVEGKYPNYQAVIPQENPNKMTIDRISFMNSLKRVSIFSNKSTHQVRLKITGSELQLTAEDLDYSNEAKERLTCSYNGEDIEIGFNSRFLVEMLNNLDSEEVVLELSAPNRAGLIIPAETQASEDILMLIMPVMLNN